MGQSVSLGALFGAVLLAIGAIPVQAADTIAVGQLVAQTGPTSAVGAVYGQGVADAFRWIDNHGGINGKMVVLDTVDYGYDSSRAIETYNR
jgi:branched-chain amino acid transport system substrate-binding protein